MPNTMTTSSADDCKLTLKQLKFVAHYLEHGNATEAALYAYDLNPDDENDRVTAGSIGYETLKKLQINELMGEAGISDQKLLTVLAQGVAATKPISALVLANTENGIVRTKDDEGRIEVEDYATRHKYLETALKLKKRLGPENVTNQQINVSSNKGNTITFVNFNHEPERK